MKTPNAEVTRQFDEAITESAARLDNVFFWLLPGQWLLAITISLFTGTYSWTGTEKYIHPHLWASTLLGAAIISYPLYLIRLYPGAFKTRMGIAIAMGMLTALLIHVSNGRTEVHFHAFVTVAILTFYRDLKVIVSYATVASVDHFIRAPFYPELVFGENEDNPILRSLEHASWLMAAIIFVLFSISRSRKELLNLIINNQELVKLQHELERRVVDRTKELKASESQARSLFDNAATGLFRVDLKGNFIAANPNFISTCGFDCYEDFIRDCPTIKTIVSDSRFVDHILESTCISMQESTLKRSDGRILTVRVSTNTYKNTEGESTYIEGCCEDITRQKEIEHCYLQSQKLQTVGQLAGGMAHNFNNILAAVRGYADLISFDSEDENVQSYADEIKTNVLRASNLTGELLSFSKKDLSDPVPQSLSDIATEVSKMLDVMIDETIEVTYELDSDLPNARFDSGQMQQVLVNLALNARDAVGKYGAIQISTRTSTFEKRLTASTGVLPKGRYAILEVADSGAGVPGDVIDNIFSPFFTTKSESGGQGLGLATCIGIIQSCGGEISVVSGENEQTKFTIYLPVCSARLEQQDGTPEEIEVDRADELFEDRTVLLVEDEPSLRLIGKKALKRLGFRVITAEDGQMALNQFRELQTDTEQGNRNIILMTDIMMPKMDGIELARTIRQTHPETSILFYSGYTNELVSEQDLQNDRSAFMQKPYSVDELKEKLIQIQTVN